MGQKMLQSYKRNWEAIMKRGSIFETDGIPRMSEVFSGWERVYSK